MARLVKGRLRPYGGRRPLTGRKPMCDWGFIEKTQKVTSNNNLKNQFQIQSKRNITLKKDINKQLQMSAIV